MKIIGLMLVRNEDWVIGCSARAALKWCDELVVSMHACTDRTFDILKEIEEGEGKGRMWWHFESDSGRWDEMEMRDKTLRLGRSRGGTHFAIVDGDEVLTANLIKNVRTMFERLQPGQCLDLPMVPAWKSLDEYAMNLGSIVTLGFADKPDLCWKPRGAEGYEHHCRPPHGAFQTMTTVVDGGVFHLQFADWRRLIWKHRHYMMSEKVRWNYPDAEINQKYHWFEKVGVKLGPVPDIWWAGHAKDRIELERPSWYEEDVKRLVASAPHGTFNGLDLFGWRPS